MTKTLQRFYLLLLFFSFLSMLYAIFLIAPTEVSMGEVQRIFYVHVSAAWTGLLFCFAAFLGSLLYLWRRTSFWDAWAYAATEIGVLFAAVVLLTGPLWARPAWGAWWTWDPRLTTTFILFLIYVAYLLLRQSIPPGRKQAIFAAVYNLFAFLNVPLVMLSVRWWRGIHPQVMGPGGGGLDPLMRDVLYFSFGTILLLAGALFYLSLWLHQYDFILQEREEL